MYLWILYSIGCHFNLSSDPSHKHISQIDSDEGWNSSHT